MKTILIVDDEPKIVRLAGDYLEHAGFSIATAGDGRSALAAVRTRRPDLVVLDLGLPGLDGLDVIRELRRDSAIPIIILTARDDEVDKLLGLELGADDYVTKPFSPRELVARVRTVLRRTEGTARRDDLLQAGDLTIDVPRMRVAVAGRPVELTASEFQLLETLARQPGRIFTRAQLLDALHGVAFESYERAIDTQVKNMRRKLEPDVGRPRYLLTVYGVGYRLADDGPADDGAGRRRTTPAGRPTPAGGSPMVADRRAVAAGRRRRAARGVPRSAMARSTRRSGLGAVG